MGTRNEAPARMAIHPGSILREELRERGIKQRELAQKMSVQPSHLCEIIQGKRPVTKNLADKLERVLGIPSIDWMRLQLAYDYDMIGMPRDNGAIEPVHPGKLLEVELSRRNITPLDLSLETGVSLDEINALFNESCRIEAEQAMLIEAAIGLKASWLLSMQNEYDILTARCNPSFMEKLRRIRQIAAAL